jgi:glycosyltransferase involved in cell wall biosynthesis
MSQPNRKSPATISIGMPVYNGEKYIREALDTILGQTFTDFELIISDNASTDTTEMICRKYADADTRVRYQRQVQNIGAEANFKFVLEQACGEYFMWAAHDDQWSKNWLEQLLEVHRKKVILSFGEVEAINSSGKSIRRCNNLSFTGNVLSRSLLFAFQDEYKGKANLIYGLFKTNTIRNVFFKEGMGKGFATDVLLLFSILQLGEISSASGAYLYKREGGAGDRVSRNYSLIRRITASYLVSYYLGYVQRASSQTLKLLLFICLPLLLARAQVIRLKRAFKQFTQNKEQHET